MKKNFERLVKIIAILVLGVFAISCGKGGKGSAEPGSIEAIKKAGKIRIGVLVDNQIGLSFWKKQNFKEIERKFLKFEKSEKEVIVMEKEI